MKIRTKLSLTFSIIASSILILFAVTVYVFSSSHRKHEFQERLIDRVDITENFFLEKDSFSSTEFERIKSQFLQPLPDETEEIVWLVPSEEPPFKYQYAKSTIADMLNKDVHWFDEGEKQGVSKLFRVGGKDYLVIVTAKDQVGLQNLSFLSYTIIILILIAIPIIFIGSFSITKRALIPITRKIRKANTINATNLHQRLNVFNPNDEIGELAIAFNKMLDRLENSFNAQRSFISNASHELRNPLTAILGEAEIAISKPRSNEEYAESVRAILAESERLNSTVTNLLHLSKVTANEGNIVFEDIELISFLKEVIESYGYTNPNNQIVLDSVPVGNNDILYIKGNKNLLKTAIINILDNACKYSSNDKVDVRLVKIDKGIELGITDRGLGITASDLDKIKNIFYRGTNTLSYKGSGIGLALSTKIIDIHKGELVITSQPEKGTKVIIRLPSILP